MTFVEYVGYAAVLDSHSVAKHSQPSFPLRRISPKLQHPRAPWQQVEALDLLDQLANDPQLNLLMELEPGDIQLVHNHTILHDRTAFEDYPEPHRKRHLLRLWLAPVEARRLPEVYAERFGSITAGERGGVSVPGVRATVPFE